MQNHMFAHAGKRMSQTLSFDGLDQIVDSIDLECIKCELAVGSNEHDSGWELQMLERFGQLKTRGFRHVDVEKHDITRIFFELLDSLTDTCCFRYNFSLIELSEKKTQFGACWRFVVYNNRL